MTQLEKELLDLDLLLYFDYKYRIPKSEILDNEVYYPAYSSKKRYNLVWGGRGSGKSFDIEGKLPVVLISCLPFCRVMMIRQVYDSIKGSQFMEVKDYIDKWGLQKEFKITTSPLSITHKASGNFITFAGMDKPDSLKSVKDITHAVFGEAFQIKSFEGFDIVDKSIRTPKIDMQKLFIVFNPDNKNHWLYERFFNPETETEFAFYREQMLSINTTHIHNKFVPASFRKLIEKDAVANPEKYKVDGLGQWGELKSLAAYYSNFESAKHIQAGAKERFYNPNKALHISFDFNVFPYITLQIKQVFDEVDKVVVCHIDEICLNEKQHGAAAVGRIEETMKEFLRRYGNHKGKVYVYGDKSGHNRKTNALSDYSTVFAFLSKNKQYPMYEQMQCSFKVEDLTNKSNNPRHETRKVFFRRMHAGVLTVLPVSKKYGTQNSAGEKRPLSVASGGKTITQIIDSRCTFLINDYQNVEEAEDGTKDARNKNLTHCTDAVDYFYAKYFDAEFLTIEADLKM